MNLTANQSADRLCAEILAEARQQATALRQQAETDVRALIEQAETTAARSRAQSLSEARQEAARRSAVIEAGTAVETQRLRALQVEQLLGELHDEILRRLHGRCGFDYPGTLVRLAQEAAARVSGDSLVLKLSPGDAADFGDELLRQLTALPLNASKSMRIVPDSSLTDGGVVVEQADGRQVYDNRFTGRLSRLWPELRRQIGNLVFSPAAGNNPGGQP